MKLSEYLKMIELGEIRPDVLPFEVSFRFLNIRRNDTAEELVNFHSFIYLFSESIFEVICLGVLN